MTTNIPSSTISSSVLPKDKPRLLMWDIETSHNIVATFDLFNRAPINYKGILQERYIICASWKWLGEDKVHAVSVLDDAKRFSKNPNDDYHVIKTLHDLLSQADGVCAHYGNNFDIKFFNTRALFHGMAPIHDVIQIDTYRIAKQKFRFNSNRLDYIGTFLGLGCKKDICHADWLSALKGDKDAIKRMVAYNKQDVRLLEGIYTRLSPFVPAKVNCRLFSSTGDEKCTRCGSLKFEYRGWSYTANRRYRRMQCKSCGGWFRLDKSEPIENARHDRQSKK